RVRNIRALNGRFNTSITHAYSIVIGSKHITLNATGGGFRSEERFSRNAETDLVCRLLLEKKKNDTKITAEDSQQGAEQERNTTRQTANYSAEVRASGDGNRRRQTLIAG